MMRFLSGLTVRDKMKMLDVNPDPLQIESDVLVQATKMIKVFLPCLKMPNVSGLISQCISL